MKLINNSNKYLKVIIIDGKHITVMFEKPVLLETWYSVFKKPNNKYVALKNTLKVRSDWKFLYTLNLNNSPFPWIIP